MVSSLSNKSQADSPPLQIYMSVHAGHWGEEELGRERNEDLFLNHRKEKFHHKGQTWGFLQVASKNSFKQPCSSFWYRHTAPPRNSPLVLDREWTNPPQSPVLFLGPGQTLAVSRGANSIHCNFVCCTSSVFKSFQQKGLLASNMKIQGWRQAGCWCRVTLPAACTSSPWRWCSRIWICDVLNHHIEAKHNHENKTASQSLGGVHNCEPSSHTCTLLSLFPVICRPPHHWGQPKSIAI